MRTSDYEILNEFSDVIRSIYPRFFSLTDGRLSSPFQAAYLHFILDHDGCSQHDITNMRFNSPATVSEVLSYLEKQGLIVRERSKADRRKVCLHLSDSGRDLAMRLREQYYSFFQNCMTDFSEEEQNELFRLLEKFVSNCPPFSKEM